VTTLTTTPARTLTTTPTATPAERTVRAVIDVGNGPQQVRVSGISSLGRALRGARPGDRVRFLAAGRPTMARVLAVEFAPAGARGQGMSP
jgi:transcription elongation GreA/GreB family factor